MLLKRDLRCSGECLFAEPVGDCFRVAWGVNESLPGSLLALSGVRTTWRADTGVYGAASIGEALPAVVGRKPVPRLGIVLNLLCTGDISMGLPRSEDCAGLLAKGLSAGNGTPPLLA